MLSYEELEARDTIEDLEDALECNRIKMDKRKDKGKKPKRKHVRDTLMLEDLIDACYTTNMLYKGELKDLELEDKRNEVTDLFESQCLSYRTQKPLLHFLFDEG